MGATDVERQRRHRAHKRGDHSLCDPQRCQRDAVTTEAVTPVTGHAVTRGPAGLGARGRRLWRELVGDSTPEASRRVLIEEACRIADRLERLDALLRGDVDTWMRLRVDLESGDITLAVDKALSEARQQAIALKQIVAELRHGAATKPEAGGSVIDQLAAKRAARIANATG